MVGTGVAVVLGATGTVGRDVVRQLVIRGASARAAMRDPATCSRCWPELDPERLDRVRFDLTDRSSWRAAVEGAATLFLLRPPQVSRVREDLLPFLDMALTAGVRRVAFLSVQGAGRNRLLPHHAVERHLAAIGCAWTSLRVGYFMQNLLTVHREEIRDRGELAVPAGRGRTAFVDTRDVAEAAAVVLTAAGEEHVRRAYELTGSRAVSYEEVAGTLTDVLGRPVRYTSPGPLEHWRRRRADGWPPTLTALTFAMYTTARLGLAAHLSSDLEGLLQRPPRSFYDFATDHAEAWSSSASAHR